VIDDDIDIKLGICVQIMTWPNFIWSSLRRNMSLNIYALDMQP